MKIGFAELIDLSSLLLPLVLSIKCYVCKEPDQKCRDPFQNDTIFLKDCSQVGMANATMCRKYMWESE